MACTDAVKFRLRNDGLIEICEPGQKPVQAKAHGAAVPRLMSVSINAIQRPIENSGKQAAHCRGGD